MTKRRKLFYYAEDTVSYVEARGYRVKFAFGVFATVTLMLGLLYVGNFYVGDVLGLDFRGGNSLAMENRILKEELRKVNARLADMAYTMDKLSERDNQLRLAVNLPKVDNDTRAVGTGGVIEETNIGLLPRNSNDALQTSKQLLEKLTREIEFQQKSYAEVYRRSEENKDLFTHIPAIKPMAGDVAAHGFGMRIDPFLHVPKMHEGVDVQADVGTPVYSTGDGIVEFAGSSGSGYGVAVEVNHGYGYRSWYAHLLRPVVHPGQNVRRGSLIAYSGNSGLSTGPHLHYEVRVNGMKVNPENFFMDKVDYRQIRSQVASLK
ncbi:MAG: M23 family metallopeptidase [Ignavibacteriales bacterium]|nr:M23 family metallopeptidase [Ignavibacteriales bacterium]